MPPLRLLTLIPAKGQSQRLQNKNLHPLAGKPLLAHTLELVHACPELQNAYVSTEDRHIAHLCAQYRMPVIHRPAALAQDNTPSEPVMRDALEQLGTAFDALLLLQPTSPLRTRRHIAECVARFARGDCASLISVTRRTIQPWPGYDMRDGWLIPSDRQAAIVPNGAIYIVNVAQFLDKGRIPLPPLAAYYMEPEDSVDIDNADDVMLAEQILSARNGAAHG